MSEWIESFMQQTSYFGVFGVLMMCGLGLPLPEDVPLLFAGYLVQQGAARFWLMVVVGMVGVLTGDCILFGLGRKYGEAILERPLLRRLVTKSRLGWAERKFLQYGKVLIFAARFMPGARPVFFSTAGIFRVRPLTFVLIDGFAAMISVPVWIYVGWRFGMEAHAHLGGKKAKYVFFGVLGVVLLCWIIWEAFQKRKHRNEEPVGDPLIHPSPPQAGKPIPPERHTAVAAPRGAQPVMPRESSAGP